MRSHEARPSSISPKLELWGGTVNTAVPPVKTLEGTVHPCTQWFTPLGSHCDSEL